MNVIAIGAHPDDIEYGCYGTMLKHKRDGDKIVFIVMSHGEKSGDKNVRKSEAVESAKKVGAKLYLFGYPDTNIPQTHDVIEKIEEIVKEFKPHRIYTHSTKDTHQDHRTVSYATLVAARVVPEIFFYESPSLYTDFKPNYYVDISSFMEDKRKVLNGFVTQNSKGYMKINAINGLAQFRGLTTFVNYAEAFEAIKILKISGT
jgi:LmbE family N-acetylglucosaminyl deacetylase